MPKIAQVYLSPDIVSWRPNEDRASRGWQIRWIGFDKYEKFLYGISKYEVGTSIYTYVTQLWEWNIFY